MDTPTYLSYGAATEYNVPDMPCEELDQPGLTCSLFRVCNILKESMNIWLIKKHPVKMPEGTGLQADLLSLLGGDAPWYNMAI